MNVFHLYPQPELWPPAHEQMLLRSLRLLSWGARVQPQVRVYYAWDGHPSYLMDQDHPLYHLEHIYHFIVNLFYKTCNISDNSTTAS